MATMMAVVLVLWLFFPLFGGLENLGSLFMWLL